MGITRLNFRHSLFYSRADLTAIVTGFKGGLSAGTARKRLQKLEDALGCDLSEVGAMAARKVMTGFADEVEGPPEAIFDIENSFERAFRALIQGPRILGHDVIDLPLGGRASALPNLDDRLSVPDEALIDDDEVELPVPLGPGSDDADMGLDADRFSDSADLADQVLGTLSHAFVGVGQLLRDELRELLYVGPLRAIPSRAYAPPRYPDEARWASGLAAWDALSNGEDDLVEQVGEWLSAAGRLDSGYSVTRRRFRLLDIAGEAFLTLNSGRFVDDVDSLKELLGGLPEEKRLRLIEQATQLELLPSDVGTGISQLVPVVVAALLKRPGVVAIEQPELHVHPRIQVRLGDLFAAHAEGRQFLLETHSEHLLLRLLKRVRETTADELEPGAPRLSKDDLAVNYFESLEPSPGGTSVRRLEVSGRGDFEGYWPEGFFDERRGELLD